MKRSMFKRYKAGHEKLVAALGEYEGDPYDVAVEAITRGWPAAAEEQEETEPAKVVDLGSGRYEMPDGSKVRGAGKVLEELGMLA